MKTKVCCEVSARGVHTFFLIHNGQEYYLFNQNYRKGVQQYYAKGVSLDEAINFSKSRRDSSVVRTMSKIPMYIKSVEKEYGIQIFEQTKRKNKNYSGSVVQCA